MEIEIQKFSKVKIVAYTISEAINLKNLKDALTGKLISFSSSELYYAIDNEYFMSVFNYGVVVFANMPELEMSKYIAFINQHSTKIIQNKIDEDYLILESAEHAISLNSEWMTVSIININLIRIVMFNLAQSLALDFYSKVAEDLLDDVKKITSDLENRGKLSVSRKNMLRFVGKILNTKNRIAENLYIFDSPDLVWDDDYLDKIHIGLVRLFELRNRYKEIEFIFRSIEDNLTVFRELTEHIENKKLEWIVIILILIEVLDMLVSKIF